MLPPVSPSIIESSDDAHATLHVMGFIPTHPNSIAAPIHLLAAYGLAAQGKWELADYIAMMMTGSRYQRVKS